MKEPFLNDIPDIWPETIPVDSNEVREIEGLHRALIKRTRDTQKRRQELADKHKVMIPLGGEQGIKVRLNMLIATGLGVLSAERMRFELRWMDVINKAVDEALQEVDEQRRRQRETKTLHLLDGSTIEVPPAATNGEKHDDAP